MPSPRAGRPSPGASATFGSLIGSIFGFVFVLVNSAPLSLPLVTAVRVIAAGAVVTVLAAAWRMRVAERSPQPARGAGFGRAYWLIVGAEVVGLFGGLALLNGPLDAPRGALGWIALVVGAHFIALAGAWRLNRFRWLGATLVSCGVIALVLAAGGASDAAIDFCGGVLSGAALLGFSVWGVTRGRLPPTDRPPR